MTLHDPQGTKGRRDPYDKGAMVLHTLRYLIGEATFAELLRRHAYPDPQVQDGKRVRLESSDNFAKRAEQVSGRDLAWFFEVYLRQTALPHLHVERSGTELRLRWDAPAGLPFPIPVEVAVDGGRQRVDMPDFGAVIVAVPGDRAAIDPDWWILRDEAPDPDRFGTLGRKAVSLDSAIQAGRTR